MREVETEVGGRDGSDLPHETVLAQLLERGNCLIVTPPTRRLDKVGTERAANHGGRREDLATDLAQARDPRLEERVDPTGCRDT